MNPLTQEEDKDFTTLAREYENLFFREHITPQMQIRLEQIGEEIQEKWGLWPWKHPEYGYVWRDEEHEALRPLDPTQGKTHFHD